MIIIIRTNKQQPNKTDRLPMHVKSVKEIGKVHGTEV